jgi:hypothetical protein
MKIPTFVFALIGVLGGTILVLGYLQFTTQTGQATIISGNTWHGGDLQTFFNATVMFRGHTTQIIFSCDYYHIGDKLQVQWTPITDYWFVQKPKGC